MCFQLCLSSPILFIICFYIFISSLILCTVCFHLRLCSRILFTICFRQFLSSLIFFTMCFHLSIFNTLAHNLFLPVPIFTNPMYIGAFKCTVTWLLNNFRHVFNRNTSPVICQLINCTICYLCLFYSIITMT